MRYEYKLLKVKQDEDFTSVLNEHGDLGWHVLQVQYGNIEVQYDEFRSRKSETWVHFNSFLMERQVTVSPLSRVIDPDGQWNEVGGI